MGSTPTPGTMYKKFKVYLFLLLIVIALIVAGGFYFLKGTKNFKWRTITEEPLITQKPTTTSMQKPKITKEKKEEIPTTYKIKNVPFTPQAPFAKWDHDHNEACEETAILIVHYFYEKKDFTPAIADKEIMAMVNYQKKNWGGHFDLEAKEIAGLAKEYYSYKNTRIIYDATIEDIKTEISKGNPVIIPTAGRLLGNPYYRRPGPLYHALVAIGYTPTKIITHDPGTKNGEEYYYTYGTIKKAMHEWNKGDIYKGRKTAILLIK